MKLQAQWPAAALLGLSLAAGQPDVAFGDEDAGAKTETRDVTVSPELQQLVDGYFQTKKREERDALVQPIEKAAKNDPFAAAEAIKQVDAWSAARAGPVNIFFPGPGRPAAAGVYEVPYDYTSDEPHPMIVCIAPEGFAPEVMLARARLFLGDHVNDFIVVATTVDVVGSFYREKDDRPVLRMLLRRLRKLVHTDTDRVYVLGIQAGAEAAWFAGMMHPDLFAGIVAINGYPRVPYPEQAYPLLLENLRHVPVLSAWNRPGPGTGGDKDFVNELTVHNRLIAKIAKRLSLPITSLELDSTKPAGQFPPKAAISEIVALDRAVAPKSIAHWFRYPDQGTAKWLRQQRFAGDVWDEQSLSIASKPDVDHDAFVTEVLTEKLAYVGGTITGQNVALTVRRTSGVELMLPMGVLEPGERVTVTCNGRTRHSSKLPPSIGVMLEDAYERWEFEHPAAVRLSLSVHAGP